MGAPKGNKFWELRSKHGRDKLFSSASEMATAACEYFQWCDDNPLFCSDWKIRGDGTYGLVDIPKKRVYTMQGLCRYLCCNTEYFAQFKKTLTGKNDADSKDFSRVVREIEEAVYEQKYSGAASGFFNANIIARDLGLTDQQKIDGKITHLNSEPLSKEEIKKISTDLDDQL